MTGVSGYRVDHEGRDVDLKELATITGLAYARLLARFKKGDRGERLVRGVRKYERRSTERA